MRTPKEKLTLNEFLIKFKIQYGLLEEKAKLPRGTIALFASGFRKPSKERLKEIQKASISLGKEMKNIELIQGKDD